MATSLPFFVYLLYHCALLAIEWQAVTCSTLGRTVRITLSNPQTTHTRSQLRPDAGSSLLREFLRDMSALGADTKAIGLKFTAETAQAPNDAQQPQAAPSTETKAEEKARKKEEREKRKKKYRMVVAHKPYCMWTPFRTPTLLR
jgi:hypothetical protein